MPNGSVNIGGVDFSVRADIDPATRDLARARANAGRAADQMESRFRDAGRNIGRSFVVARRGADDFSASVRRSNLEISALGVLSRAVIGGIVAGTIARGVGTVATYSDAWISARNALVAAGIAAEDVARQQSALLTLANDTRTSIGSTVDLYARLTRASDALGVSQAEVFRATEILNKAFQTSGGTVAETQSAILQLGQALGSGVLQGDELRSIRENSPLIARAIAEEFGVTIGQLKKLGEEGRLTSARVFAAIQNIGEEVDRTFAATTATMGQRIDVLGNKFAALGAKIGTALGLDNPYSGINQLIERFGNGLLVLGGAIDGRARDSIGIPVDMKARLDALSFEMAQVTENGKNLESVLGSGRLGELLGGGPLQAGEQRKAAALDRLRAMQAEIAATVNTLDATIADRERRLRTNTSRNPLDVFGTAANMAQGRISTTMRKEISDARFQRAGAMQWLQALNGEIERMKAADPRAFLGDFVADIGLTNAALDEGKPRKYSTALEDMQAALVRVRNQASAANAALAAANADYARVDLQSESGLQRLQMASVAIIEAERAVASLNSSRAALAAILDLGNSGTGAIPQAMDAIRATLREGLITEADAKLGSDALAKLAADASAAFGSEASRARSDYAARMREIAQAQAAVAATGAQVNATIFDEARAEAAQELADATRQWTADFAELAALIEEMRSPSEALAESMAALDHLRAGEERGSAGYIAAARKEVELLAERARVAGLAADAMRELRRLAVEAHLDPQEIVRAQNAIRSGASEGREGRAWLSSAQAREAAADSFAGIFATALTNGARSGDFGEAMESAFADALTSALATAAAQIGRFLADAIFSGDAPMLDALFGAEAAIAQDAAAASAASLAVAGVDGALAINGLALAAAGAATALAAVSATSGASAAGDVFSAVESFFFGIKKSAHGNALRAGEPSWVGEAGRELFVPATAGYIVPHSKLTAGANVGAAGVGASQNLGIRMGDIIVSGGVGSQQQIAEIQRMQMQQARALPGIIRATMRQMQARGG